MLGVPDEEYQLHVPLSGRSEIFYSDIMFLSLSLPRSHKS